MVWQFNIFEMLIRVEALRIDTTLKKHATTTSNVDWITKINWYTALSVIVLVAMYYFHPAAVRERQASVPPNRLTIHDSFQTQSSVEKIDATPPIANALPLEILSPENV